MQRVLMGALIIATHTLSIGGHQVSYLNIYKASPLLAYCLETKVREAARCFVQRGKFAEQRRRASSLLHVFFKEARPRGSSINDPYHSTIFLYLFNLCGKFELIYI